MLGDGTYDSIDALSAEHRVHSQILCNGIRLAFLAPSVTAAILKETQPEGLELASFTKKMPLNWLRHIAQFQR